MMSASAAKMWKTSLPPCALVSSRPQPALTQCKLDTEVADKLLGLPRRGRTVAGVDGAGW
jgi:hypothetical protein